MGSIGKNFVFLRMKPPYVPAIKSDADTSNFEEYPDSVQECPRVDKNNDLISQV